jgi:hypothetical protein
MSLRSVMESTPRCILRYVPTRGWAATDIEGSSDHDLIFADRPNTALQIHLKQRLPTVMLQNEIDTIQRVQDSAKRWACEWWENRWHRVFAE